jgi:excisionase family DNA binding protein
LAEGGAPKPDERIGIKEAAQRLGIHGNTLRGWIDRGHVHAYRLPTGRRILLLSEIERIERETFGTPAPADAGAAAGDEPGPAHDREKPASP